MDRISKIQIEAIRGIESTLRTRGTYRMMAARGLRLHEDNVPGMYSISYDQAMLVIRAGQDLMREVLGNIAGDIGDKYVKGKLSVI